MKRIFRVTINYLGGGTNDVNVVAKDDIAARAAAIAQDAKLFKDNGMEQSKIKFCEVRYIGECVNAR
jgi:hypothetical protein